MNIPQETREKITEWVSAREEHLENIKKIINKYPSLKEGYEVKLNKEGILISRSMITGTVARYLLDYCKLNDLSSHIHAVDLNKVIMYIWGFN